MLDEYTAAFARYLRTGAVGALSGFCAGDADLSRLRVYRNGFLKACIEALRASYPSVERLVGEERFPALARPYVEAHPPRAAGLVEYGEDFPRFIEDARDAHRLDWLASFAALDRAWSEVCFAEDPDPGGGAAETVPAGGVPGDDAGAHAGPDRRPARTGKPRSRRQGSGGQARRPARTGKPAPAPEPGGPGSPGVPGTPGTPGPAADPGLPAGAEALMNLRGRLSPWVRLVSLEYRALHAWSELRRGGRLGPGTEVRRMPQQVLIWRSGAGMLYRDLAPPEHAFFAGVAAGRPCGEAAGAALDVDPAFDPVAAFASLLHHRMLAFGH